MKRSLALVGATGSFDGRELEGTAQAHRGRLKNPESVCLGPGPERRIFVTTIGDFDKDGDGAVMVVEPGGKTEPFVTGLDDPKGIAVYQKWLFLTDKTKVIRIDATAKSPKAEVLAAADKFPFRQSS